MLHKKIVTSYGKSLTGSPSLHEDPVHFLAPEAERLEFRQQAMDDISAARVFILDEEAANYADSLHDQLLDRSKPEVCTSQVSKIMAEVELPAELVFVEHDHFLLASNRVKRGHTGYDELGDFGQRGYLIDNRNPDFLKVTVFRTEGTGGRVIDPFTHANWEKSTSGEVKFGKYTGVMHQHMLGFYEAAGATEDDLRQIVEQEMNDASYDLALGFMVFALIATKENSGVVYEEKASLSPKEVKTARKFGKTWMTDALRSHITIRIGEEGRAHLAEQIARRKHESDVASGRASPTEHWVAEHERRYANGKIVTIKAHKRGVKPDPSVTTLVKGPRPL